MLWGQQELMQKELFHLKGHGSSHCPKHSESKPWKSNSVTDILIR